MNATLADLRESRRISPAHGALVQLVCSLADAVDADPSNASLWREYRGAVTDLTKLAEEASDAFSDLIARLRSPVGDSSN